MYCNSVGSDENALLEILLRSARNCPIGEHTLTSDPDAANVILLPHVDKTDSLLRGIRDSDIYTAHRQKTFCYSERDPILPMVRGLYPNISSRLFRKEHYRAAPYVALFRNEFIVPTPVDSAEFLYGFRGSRSNHAVRERILEIKDDRSLLIDSEDAYQGRLWWTNLNPTDLVAARRLYAEELARVKFVLCPRGVADGSVRVFQAMEAGRVPVVIADGWTRPDGPDWSKCMVQISESEVLLIPKKLRELEETAEELATNARKAWEKYFSPDMIFHQSVESCLSIMATQSPKPSYPKLVGLMKDPRYRRLTLRHLAKFVKGGQKS